jgi:hypothetical protein
MKAGAGMTIEKKNTIPYFQVPNNIFDLEITVKVKETKKGIETVKERLLSSNEKIVLMFLCRCGNNQASAFPSYNTIAHKCGMSRRTAVYAINVLTDNKIIQKVVRKIDDKITEKTNQTNIYIIPSGSAINAPSKTKGSARDAPSLVQNLHQPSARDAPIKRTNYKEQYKKKEITEFLDEEYLKHRWDTD